MEHLALVEDHYFTHQLHGRDYPAVWVPMAEQDDWEWTSAADDSPEELRTLWLEAVARSEAASRRLSPTGALIDVLRSRTGRRRPTSAECLST